MTDDARIEATLTRLADGSLPERAAGQLRARVHESPELSRRLRAQRRALGLIALTTEVTAPVAVRVAASGRGARRSPRPVSRIGGAIGSPLGWAPLAAAALTAAVVVPGESRTLTVARTAQVALATSSSGVPRVDPAHSELLNLRVDSIAFPAYESRSDRRATGVRTEEVDARRVQTVFYDISGRRVGYSVVSGSALRVPRGRRHVSDGVTYVTGASGPGELVTWRRDGHGRVTV